MLGTNSYPFTHPKPQCPTVKIKDAPITLLKRVPFQVTNLSVQSKKIKNNSFYS